MVVDHGSVGVIHDYPSLHSHARERRLRRISPFGSVRSASVSTKLTHVIRNLYLSVVSISYNKTISSCQPFFLEIWDISKKITTSSASCDAGYRHPKTHPRTPRTRAFHKTEAPSVVRLTVIHPILDVSPHARLRS